MSQKLNYVPEKNSNQGKDKKTERVCQTLRRWRRTLIVSCCLSRPFVFFRLHCMHLCSHSRECKNSWFYGGVKEANIWVSSSAGRRSKRGKRANENSWRLAVAARYRKIFRVTNYVVSTLSNWWNRGELGRNVFRLYVDVRYSLRNVRNESSVSLYREKLEVFKWQALDTSSIFLETWNFILLFVLLDL